MQWTIAIYAFALLSLTCAIVYFAVQSRRGRGDSRKPEKEFDFCPSIGFARQDGWQSVALLLDNKTDVIVWTEEIEMVLTDLVATRQASDPSVREVLKIRQHVRPHDLLPISLVETIYQAAGRPQRNYSCVLSSIVRYRVGEKWFEEPMRSYRLKMMGLKVANIRRENKVSYPFEPWDKPKDLHTANIGSK
ncbi:MAG TPA: hypothetical protein VNI36_07040 [Candidatus Dormibacteraeota bacterium]|nr:hypothetical protein [Candidatus Dormibacteraeota bacterium]